MHQACNNVLVVQELLAPLQTAFSLGLQYPPLATAAIAAIERWETEQPQALRAVAPEIVPLLDPYLLEMTALAADSQAADAAQGKGSPRVTPKLPVWLLEDAFARGCCCLLPMQCCSKT